MLINQNAGSGGDAMPWYFRKAGIGSWWHATWGGLVGIGVSATARWRLGTAPRYAIYASTATGSEITASHLMWLSRSAQRCGCRA